MAATPHLLLQLAVILGTARVLAWLLGRLGQPPVIGEMLAGLLLGPLAFGALAPHWQASLFPREGLAALEGIGQIGLVLFMVVVGAELRAPDALRSRLVAGGRVALLGMLLPGAFGLAIAPGLHARFAPPGTAFVPFALFLAVALAITAFPVLARILKERALTQGEPGQLALAAAAITDVLAWLLLALVIAVAGSSGGWHPLAITLAGLVAVAACTFGILRPLCARMLAHVPEGGPGTTVLGLLLAMAAATAAATAALGLHPVFGAFLFGTCLPRDERLRQVLVDRIEPVAVLVLMPVFFTLAGLGTSAAAFDAAGLSALLLILAAAFAGKLLGAGAGARASGLGWRDSLAVGALMNTRGLMELIVLEVGMEAGLIGAELFTLLLAMTLLTTLSTAPLLDLCRGRGLPPARVPAQ
jgi:K+:H+ antiporter